MSPLGRGCTGNSRWRNKYVRSYYKRTSQIPVKSSFATLLAGGKQTFRAADLDDARYGLAAHCWRCNRWHDLDIAGLAANHGDRSIINFKPRCSVCGERAEKQMTSPMPKFGGYPK
jgi:hypothetical protein